MDLAKEIRGQVFNIQCFSLHDGPGIRMTVFLKGCSLACKWCHNPESISHRPELQWNPDMCLLCGACEICPRQSHQVLRGQAVHLYDRQSCTGCGDCADLCVTGALKLIGKQYTPTQILAIAEQERGYFADDGGITFSGGEAMLQIDFLEQAMKLCVAAGFHTAVDTAGNVPFTNFERLLSYQPLFLYDIKHWDSDKHKRYTGAGNGVILQNFQKLLQHGAKIWVRIPVIPGFNNTDSDINKIGQIILECQKNTKNKVERVELLPFHNIGVSKYASLGKYCDWGDEPSMQGSILDDKRRLLRNMGLSAV